MDRDTSFDKKSDTSVRDVEDNQEDQLVFNDDAYGGTEARKALERKLLFKLDLRMSILIVIYILNYVRVPLHWLVRSLGTELHHILDRP